MIWVSFLHRSKLVINSPSIIHPAIWLRIERPCFRDRLEAELAVTIRLASNNPLYVKLGKLDPTRYKVWLEPYLQSNHLLEPRAMWCWELWNGNPRACVSSDQHTYTSDYPGNMKSGPVHKKKLVNTRTEWVCFLAYSHPTRGRLRCQDMQVTIFRAEKLSVTGPLWAKRGAARRRPVWRTQYSRLNDVCRQARSREVIRA